MLIKHLQCSELNKFEGHISSSDVFFFHKISMDSHIIWDIQFQNIDKFVVVKINL